MRRRGAYVPYLLLLPGMLWLVVFFLVPMLSLASQSLQTGDVDNGYTLTFNFATYSDALGTYWPQLLRSLIYAGTATVATLALGPFVQWYPYPFINVDQIGYARTLVNCAVIAVLFFALAAAARWADKRLPTRAHDRDTISS